MPSLGIPQLHTTLQQQHMLGNKTIYEMILCTVWMKPLAPFNCTTAMVQLGCSQAIQTHSPHHYLHLYLVNVI